MATEAHDTHTLALPTPGAGPQMRMLPVGGIVASLTNPRKIFKAEPLQELAHSIQASGVHQPILVRPLPAARLEETSRALRSSVLAWPFATTRKREPIEYELVAGERRWRACQLAGVAEIPAMIRELTDEQALEVQVVENLQREDVTELEEAGACGDCPKRTGANPDLFKDVDSADVCTDPKCYRAKEDAHTAQVVAAAQAKGQTVIAGDEAAELAYDNYNSKLKGYRRLDSVDDSPTDKPLRSIIGKQMEAEGIKPTMIANPRKRSELLACLPNEVVLRLLKAVEGQAKATKEVAAEVKELVKTKEAKALEKAKAKYEQAWRDRLLDLAWAQIEGQMPYQFTADVHRYLLRREINSLSQDDAAALANILNLGKMGAHNALQDFAQTTRSPDQLHLLVIMQRDSGASHYAHGRPKNEGLMLVAGIALGDGLDAAVKESQARAAAEHLPQPAKTPAKPDNTAGQEGTLTPPPAAQASPTRAKAKKSRGPAAHAGEVPKTSAAHAAALIAAELAALEDQNQAPAAQGNEALPAPSGGDAPATHGQAGADAETAATVNEGGAIAVGATVRVNDTATGKKQAPHIGKTGTVLRQIGPDAWDVSIPREKRGVPLFVCFHTTELEVVNA